MSKTWTGSFRHLCTVSFSQKGGGLKHAFTGTADVYEFRSTDSTCKVSHAAVIRDVSIAVMCGSSGDVGAAILRSAGLAATAKNSGVNGCYDTFPDPIGCPADRLQDHDLVHTLTFYRKH
jgi:hypothetical protein